MAGSVCSVSCNTNAVTSLDTFSETSSKKEDIKTPPYTDTFPYAVTAISLAVLGIGIALSTTKLVIIIAGSILAIIGASVFEQIIAYDAAHPDGSKTRPTIHKFMLYGVGGGIVKIILLITAITIKLLVVI